MLNCLVQAFGLIIKVLEVMQSGTGNLVCKFYIVLAPGTLKLMELIIIAQNVVGLNKD